MHIRPLPGDEASLRRFTTDLWIPYNRDLEAAVADHALADDVDLVGEQTEFWQEQLDREDYRAWIAVDDESAGGGDGTDPNGEDEDSLADLDADLVGFVTTSVDESPSVFHWPDRLVVGDFYVAEAYRGTGLADDLLARASERARELGCGELALDVDVDNERALAFYEKYGFQPRRYRMRVAVEDL